MDKISPKLVGVVMNLLFRATKEVPDGTGVVIIKARRRFGPQYRPCVSPRCEAQVLGYYYEHKRAMELDTGRAA